MQRKSDGVSELGASQVCALKIEAVLVLVRGRGVGREVGSAPLDRHLGLSARERSGHRQAVRTELWAASASRFAAYQQHGIIVVTKWWRMTSMLVKLPEFEQCNI